ncbi:PASTA domain-containing protein [Balneolales bacterium ANBcel1]|nr:PASTA domain-containing protein [Balneolales bacterium ANBcel1]
MKKALSFIFHFFTDRKLYYLLGGLILFGGISLIAMDRYIMPAYTNYQDGITVPDVSRMPLEQAALMLEERGLRHELAAKRSNEAFPPDFVIDQTPAAGMIVKPNRKVYITVNATSTPTVVVPEVENLSLRNATIQLENSGLQVGNITYESSRFRNSVLRQSIPSGRRVDQNTTVDIVVGDGLGTAMVSIPDISNMHLTEAQNVLREAGLRVGSIHFEPTAAVQPNTVLRYDPDDQPAVYEGTAIDLVVSVSPGEEEEEETGPIIIEDSAPDTTGDPDSSDGRE